jgi:ribulose-5-phosphate 4-epimerase/fuculose-1-phosphate aldolase
MASKRTPHSPFLEFRDVEEERLHLKQRLAAAFRIFGRFGFDEGVAGHITARDPEHADRFWVNPFGMNFKHITVDDLICCDHSGTVVEGTWPVNQAAFAIHSQVHAARPDVVAAAHSHSVHGKAFSASSSRTTPSTTTTRAS